MSVTEREIAIVVPCWIVSRQVRRGCRGKRRISPNFGGRRGSYREGGRDRTERVHSIMIVISQIDLALDETESNRTEIEIER